MKNKKGFVFVETIVVIVVLLTSLLYLYSTFITLSTNEKKRITYDDVAYLYRTYSLKKYYTSQRLDRIVSNLSEENPVVSFGCESYDLFDHYEKEGSFCESITQELHVTNTYVTFYDLSDLQNCHHSSSGICTIFSRVDTNLSEYLKTLSGKGESGFRLIVEFSENDAGELCENNEHCTHYFATIKVGDDL